MEVTVQEAKTHLSRLLRKVEAGETVVIRRGKHRVAMLTVAADESPKRNIWGDLKGVVIHDDFDDIPEGFEEYL